VNASGWPGWQTPWNFAKSFSISPAYGWRGHWMKKTQKLRDTPLLALSSYFKPDIVLCSFSVIKSRE
jgi:hypothetical protein